MRETQGPDGADAGCPADQHAQCVFDPRISKTRVSTRVFTSKLGSSRTVHKTDPSCSAAGIQHATCVFGDDWASEVQG